jgi:Protein of unknown function (DUF1579)
MRMIALAALAVGIFVSGVSAQPAPRKPGEEEKRIGYFAGQWVFEGEAKATPMGPGGKISARETCEWFTGGFHVVCRSDGTSPRGSGKGQSTMGYDPIEKTYTFYAISSLGEGFFVRGTVNGPVWTWNSESTVEGKLIKIRVTITEESPMAYAFKMEGSFDNGPWTVMEEGRAKKVKS